MDDDEIKRYLKEFNNFNCLLLGFAALIGIIVIGCHMPAIQQTGSGHPTISG